MKLTQEKLREITINRQFAALGNPEIEVSALRLKTQGGLISLGDNGKPQTIGKVILRRCECKELFYQDQDLEIDNYSYIKALNSGGWNIYMKPYENSALIYILVDDLRPEFFESDFTPNLILQTSPASKQAVFSVPFKYDRSQNEDRRIYKDIFNFMNLKFGDPHISGLRHNFRLATLSNRKPSYEQDGKFPFVQLLSARKTICKKFVKFIDDCYSGRFPLYEEIEQLKAIYRPSSKNTEETSRRSLHRNSGLDHRGDDFSYALKKAWEGKTVNEIKELLHEHSKHLEEPCGYDLNVLQYIEKTSENACEAVEKSRKENISKKKKLCFSHLPSPGGPWGRVGNKSNI